MKKFTKTALSLGLATSLLVPTTSFATSPKSVVQQSIQKGQNDAKQTMDTFIVKYSERITKKEHVSLGATVIQSIPALKYDVVRIQKGQDTKEVFKKYEKIGKVKSIAPSVQYKKFATNDEKVGDAYALSSLKIEEAWKLAGNNEVKVAVIDTGTNVKHPELKHSMIAPYNAVNPAHAVVPDVHGTHVSGIVSAKENNKIGAHGINPNAKVMSIDVFNGGEGAADFNIAKGILHAVEQGVDVINMSLGGPQRSTVVQEAIYKAVENNVVVVAAAGNESTDMYSYPAAYDGVISVGATNDKKELTDFSNFGPSMDIVAPGAEIFSTISTPAKPNTYAKLDGTSMASPVVAGVVSLIKSKHPDLNTYQVEALLKQTADDLGETGYDSKYGHGLVNAIAALNYDVSKLPKYEKKGSAATLESAAAVTIENNTAEKTGALKSPFESQGYKMNLEAGNYAQFTLSATEAFDYKLRLHFYPEGSTEATETVTVNDGFAGRVESGLFKAPSKGTLVAEVMDANGNYAVSGASTYSLTMNAAESEKDEVATMENPYSIASLPFKSKDMQEGAPTFVSEEGVDTDYYRVQFPYSGYGSVNVEAIAGLNTAISIYPEGKAEDAESYIYGDSGFVNEKESIAFPVQAYQTYIVEVTGNPGVEEFSENRTYGSILPYELTIDMANMPADEDNFSVQNKELDIFSGEPLTAEQSAKMMQSAVAMNLTDKKTALLQQDQDVDLYKVKATEDTIVSTGLAGDPLGETMLKLYEYDEESGVLAEKMDNSLFGMLLGGGAGGQNQLLEANKQYVVAVTSLGSITGQPYELAMNEITKVEKDQHGANNDPETATPITINSSVKDRAIDGGDMDMYYYKPTEDTLTSFSLNVVGMDPAEMAKYPGSLVSHPLYTVLVMEDTNGNGTIDPEEEEKVSPYVELQASISGSFQGKKDVGYFIAVLQHPFLANLNIREYELSLTAVNGEDEDKDSVVKKNIPSKPLALTAGDNGWTATGLYNGGVEFGDSDYYLFNNNKKQNVTVSVTSPAGLDSVLSIYNHKGRLIQKVDTYFVGDTEEVTVNLNKGRYFIKVEEVNGASSNNPYTVGVKVK